MKKWRVSNILLHIQTCRRVFISKKQKFFLESTRNSTVPAEEYFTAFARDTACSPIALRVSGSRKVLTRHTNIQQCRQLHKVGSALSAHSSQWNSLPTFCLNFLLKMIHAIAGNCFLSRPVPYCFHCYTHFHFGCYVFEA